MGERERRYKSGQTGEGRKGREKRRETCQHFSPPVTTKTTKNSFVTLFPFALSLPPLRHSFLPSFLFIYSPHAFFPFPLQIGIERGATVEKYAVEYVIQCEEAETMHHMVLLPFRFSGFSYQTSCSSRYRHCLVFLANKCMNVNYKKVLSDALAANLPNLMTK